MQADYEMFYSLYVLPIHELLIGKIYIMYEITNLKWQEYVFGNMIILLDRKELVVIQNDAHMKTLTCYRTLEMFANFIRNKFYVNYENRNFTV